MGDLSGLKRVMWPGRSGKIPDFPRLDRASRIFYRSEKYPSEREKDYPMMLSLSGNLPFSRQL